MKDSKIYGKIVKNKVTVVFYYQFYAIIWQSEFRGLRD